MGTTYTALILACPRCNIKFKLQSRKKSNSQWTNQRDSIYCPDCLSTIVSKTVIYDKDKNSGQIPKNLLHYLQ